MKLIKRLIEGIDHPTTLLLSPVRHPVSHGLASKGLIWHDRNGYVGRDNTDGFEHSLGHFGKEDEMEKYVKKNWVGRLATY